MSADAHAESIEIMIGGWKCASCGYAMYPYSLPGDVKPKGPSGLVCSNNSCRNKGRVVRNPIFTVEVVCHEFTS